MSPLMRVSLLLAGVLSLGAQGGIAQELKLTITQKKGVLQAESGRPPRDLGNVLKEYHELKDQATRGIVQVKSETPNTHHPHLSAEQLKALANKRAAAKAEYARRHPAGGSTKPTDDINTTEYAWGTDGTGYSTRMKIELDGKPHEYTQKYPGFGQQPTQFKIDKGNYNDVVNKLKGQVPDGVRFTSDLDNQDRHIVYVWNKEGKRPPLGFFNLTSHKDGSVSFGEFQNFHAAASGPEVKTTATEAVGTRLMDSKDRVWTKMRGDFRADELPDKGHLWRTTYQVPGKYGDSPDWRIEYRYGIDKPGKTGFYRLNDEKNNVEGEFTNLAPSGFSKLEKLEPKKK